MFGRFVANLQWAGKKAWEGAERVGEAVVSVLGLDESMFQEVLDNMTEEELIHARQVNEEREREYRNMQKELPNSEEHIIVDLEAIEIPLNEAEAIPLQLEEVLATLEGHSNEVQPQDIQVHHDEDNKDSLKTAEDPTLLKEADPSSTLKDSTDDIIESIN